MVFSFLTEEDQIDNNHQYHHTIHDQINPDVRLVAFIKFFEFFKHNVQGLAFLS